MDEKSSYNEYKVLLWSDPHKNRPYSKQRKSGVSSTSFGNRKADGFHRLIDSGAVDAVFHVGDTYSVYQEDYDNDGFLAKPQITKSHILKMVRWIASKRSISKMSALHQEEAKCLKPSIR